MTTNPEISKLNGKDRPDMTVLKANDSKEKPPLEQSEQDVLFRLKSAIDSRGRYAYRLNDMAAGFAAGTGVSPTVARRTIENKFSDQFGVSPQEYLDRHYEEMRKGEQRRESDEKISNKEVER